MIHRLAQHRRRHRGLGLIEAMIALAITAALLTGVAVAFVASSSAVSNNDQFFRATQASRISLNRILTQIRRGTVDTNSTATSLHLLTDTNQDYTYSYNSTSQQLKLVTNSITTDADYVLARNVTTCSFSYQTGTNYAAQTCVMRVAVLMTVKVGNNQVLVSGSAAPRGNFSF